ncbi:chemotaxis protein CheW, partial [Desulfobacterales bacterium HSG17]|nr:chemotaxis protein CheW [Desulfobacterales bacterium HSG17]
SEITKVPGTPDFMRGIINVRGAVVPVMDMRTKFGLAEIESTVNTRIIVMEISIDEEMVVIGAIADSVHEVTELKVGQIEDPPKIGSRWRTEFIKGIGKRDDNFIIILDINRVFSAKELEMAEALEVIEPEIALNEAA